MPTHFWDFRASKWLISRKQRSKIGAFVAYKTQTGVVENSFVARLSKDATERYTRDGIWIPYPDRWDVITNGRLLCKGEDPVTVAEELFAEE